MIYKLYLYMFRIIFKIICFQPEGNGISVDTLQGNALETVYRIQVLDYYDEDSPISYKYHLYLSPQYYEKEKINGSNSLKPYNNVIYDYTYRNDISIKLPSGNINPDNNKHEILVMVSVKDYKGAITNVT